MSDVWGVRVTLMIVIFQPFWNAACFFSLASFWRYFIMFCQQKTNREMLRSTQQHRQCVTRLKKTKTKPSTLPLYHQKENPKCLDELRDSRLWCVGRRCLGCRSSWWFWLPWWPWQETSGSLDVWGSTTTTWKTSQPEIKQKEFLSGVSNITKIWKQLKSSLITMFFLLLLLIAKYRNAGFSLWGP